MVSRYRSVMMQLSLGAILGWFVAWIYARYVGRLSACWIDGAPQPCWSCGTCPVRWSWTVVMILLILIAVSVIGAGMKRRSV